MAIIIAVVVWYFCDSNSRFWNSMDGTFGTLQGGFFAQDSGPPGERHRRPYD